MMTKIQTITLQGEKNADLKDIQQKHGNAAVLKALSEAEINSALGADLSYVFAHELGDTYEPPEEIVEGILTAGDGSVLYGDSNSGKTFLVIDMACAIARGIDWMGRKTEQGLVIYLAAESPASVRRRLQGYQKHHNIKVPNFAIVQSPIDLFDGDADTNRVISMVKIIEAETGQKSILIIGDTLARLSAGANENAGQDMGIVVRHFDQIRTETNAHFLLIHHSGKNAAAGARGWSGVRAAVDTEMEVTDSVSGRCCEITKQRDLSTKGERIGFKLESVHLGYTKWDKPSSVAIVVSADAPIKEKSKRINETGGAILEFLRTKAVSVKKADVVKHFDDRYAKGNIYREIKKLVDAGQAYDMAGMVGAETQGGAKVQIGAND
ncbi:MAG: helicase RepA family protein [Methylotenera sp.]